MDRRGPKLSVRNSILMTILIFISIPGFILYEIFNNTRYYYKEVGVISLFLRVYYIVISRIINIMVKDLKI
jgi:hypothetical protein